MTERDLSTYTERDLADPAIEPATLGHLATARPDLRPAILAHPNCYPALAEWLRARVPADQQPAAGAAQGGAAGHGGAYPAAGQTGAAQPSPGVAPYGASGSRAPYGRQPHAAQGQQASPSAATQTPEAWASNFQQRVGREPSMSEYQAAVAAGEVAQTRTTPSFAAGAQEAAAAASAGAKDFFQNRLAPAAQGAARSFQQTVTDRNATPMAKLIRIAGFALPAIALLAIVSLFLPAATVSGWGQEESISMFEGGDGVVLLVFFILAIAGAVAWIVLGATWARITAACLGAVGGVVALIATILVFSGVSGAGGFGVSASAGFGTVILLLLSILMIAAAALMFFPTEKKAAAGPYASPAGAGGHPRPAPAGAGGQPDGAGYPGGAPASGYPGAPQASSGSPYGQPAPGSPYGQRGPESPATPSGWAGETGDRTQGPYGPPPAS